jgi:hypothetical protein
MAIHRVYSNVSSFTFICFKSNQWLIHISYSKYIINIHLLLYWFTVIRWGNTCEVTTYSNLKQQRQYVRVMIDIIMIVDYYMD